MGSFGVQRILLSHYQCRAKKKHTKQQKGRKKKEIRTHIHDGEARNEKATLPLPNIAQIQTVLRVTI